MNKTEKNLDTHTASLNIYNSYLKTISKLENYKNIVCMISGGADSDIVMDIVCNLDIYKKVQFVWINTGVEYDATKTHLNFLQAKYNRKIVEVKAIKSVPTCCKTYGQPFFSKYISEMLERLQHHRFDFKNDGNKNFIELKNKYEKCLVALKWWCSENGGGSSFNINRNLYLKEYIIENPPNFKISQKCCYYAKKLPAQKYKIGNNCDLDIVGTRQQENGIRSTQYKNCFTSNYNKWDNYRIIFFYTDKDKQLYDNNYDIVHSDCYKVWGMIRTGCFGCPFNSKFEEELSIAQKYEPNKYKAMMSMFGESYTYKRNYLKYQKAKKLQLKENGQINFFNKI